MGDYTRERQLRDMRTLAVRSTEKEYESTFCGVHGAAAKTQWAADFPCRLGLHRPHEEVSPRMCAKCGETWPCTGWTRETEVIVDRIGSVPASGEGEEGKCPRNRSS